MDTTSMPKAQTEPAEATLRLAKNLGAVIAASGLTVTGWARANGLKQPTIHRILHNGMSVTTNVLQEIADACSLEPWQLLVADLDPANPPVLRNVTGREARFYAHLEAAMQSLKEGNGNGKSNGD